MPGEEVLVADENPRDRAGLVALAEKLGLVPSAVESASLARERLTGKFYAVALIDMDLPGGAIDLLEFIRERSRATQVVMLTARKNFDAAVQAFRLGCVDVVFKRPDEIARLERGVAIALDRYHETQGQGLDDVVRMLDELITTVIALGRQVYAADIDSMTEMARAQINVLFVDDDTRFLKEVSELVVNVPMDAAVEMSGGGALDKIGAHSFDIVVTRATLNDLPGSIVVNAAQQRLPSAIGLLYSPPGMSGRIERIVEGKTLDTYTPFQNARHLAERVQHLVEEEHARRRERKVLQVVGSKHPELLRKYAEAKRKLVGRTSVG